MASVCPQAWTEFPASASVVLAPNETFVYRFPVTQSGTYWYHSHSGSQEQAGMSGALILDRKDADAVAFDREYMVLLTDWTDTNPETVLSNLKQESEYYNYRQRTAGTFFSDVKKNGLGATLSERRMWGSMNMTPTDILDVTGATYTYLPNGNTPNANWTGLYKAGERVRVRFINGSAMTFFDVRIPGLPMTVVQSDGNDVEPVTVDEFRIGLAETYDVIVEPKDEADIDNTHALSPSPNPACGGPVRIDRCGTGYAAREQQNDARHVRTVHDGCDDERIEQAYRSNDSRLSICRFRQRYGAIGHSLSARCSYLFLETVSRLPISC